MRNRKELMRKIIGGLIIMGTFCFEIYIYTISNTDFRMKQIVNMILLFFIISIPVFVAAFKIFPRFIEDRKIVIGKTILILTTIYSFSLFILHTYFDVSFITNYVDTLSLISLLLYIAGFSLTLEFSQAKKYILDKRDLLVLIPILIFLCTSIYHLGKFFSVDEYKWLYERVPQYIEAQEEYNWKETFVNDKPGILTTYLSSITFKNSNILEKITDVDIEEKANLLSLWRLPIVIFNTVSLGILYFVSKNILSRRASFMFISFISITPMLIGISQVVNPDATLWICTIISLLGFIGAVKRDSFPLLLISGIYLGFSFLSKYFAITCLLLIFIYPFLKFLKENNKENFMKYLSYSIFTVSIAILTFCILCPAVLLDVSILSDLTISSPITASFSHILIPLVILYLVLPIIKIDSKYFPSIKILNILISIFLVVLFIVALIGSFEEIKFFNLSNFFYESAKRRDESFLNILIGSTIIQIYTNLLIVSPLFLISLYKLIRDSIKDNFDEISLLLLIGILINLLGPALGNFIPIPRYEVCIYPLILFFISKEIFSQSHLSTYITIIGLTILTSLDIFQTSPYYLLYTNYLGILNPSFVTEPWGFGGYEIAEYITENIDENEMIWTDREGVCIFLSNPCRVREWNPFLLKYNFKYMVLTNTGYSRTLLSEDTYTEKTSDLWDEYYFEKESIYEGNLLKDSDLFNFKIVRIEENDKMENTDSSISPI